MDREQTAQTTPRPEVPKSETFDWFVVKVSQGEVFQISDVSALPPEAESERSLLEAQGIRSLLIMPMGSVGRPTGFVGFDNVREADEWRPEDIDQLRIVSQLMGDALERQRSHQALELSVQRQKAILENIPDIAWLKDEDSRFIHVNEPFARSCGVTADELIGKTDLAIWHWFHDRSIRLLDVEGEVVIEGLAFDITVQKRAEQELLESEQCYRGVVEDTPVLICRFLPGGEITFVNEAYCRFFEKTAEELVGRTFLKFIDAFRDDRRIRCVKFVDWAASSSPTRYV